jgi:hypothetical protein
VADDREPNRTAAHHDRDVAPTDLAAAHGVQRHGHRFGQRGEVGRQTVGDDEAHRRLRKHLLGVSAWRQRGESGQVHAAVGPDQGEGYDERAVGERLGDPAATLGDLTAELVAHHDGRIGPHEVRIADLRHHVLKLVGMVLRVQVGSADAASPHREDELALLRLRIGEFDDVE